MENGYLKVAQTLPDKFWDFGPLKKNIVICMVYVSSRTDFFRGRVCDLAPIEKRLRRENHKFQKGKLKITSFKR